MPSSARATSPTSSWPRFRLLAPFGQANPEPLLQVTGARLDSLRTMGRDGKHLKARVSGTPVEVVWWGAGELGEALRGPVDLLGHLRENRWRGRRTLQLDVRDARSA